MLRSRSPHFYRLTRPSSVLFRRNFKKILDLRPSFLFPRESRSRSPFCQSACQLLLAGLLLDYFLMAFLAKHLYAATCYLRFLTGYPHQKSTIFLLSCEVRDGFSFKTRHYDSYYSLCLPQRECQSVVLVSWSRLPQVCSTPEGTFLSSFESSPIPDEKSKIHLDDRATSSSLPHSGSTAWAWRQRLAL